MTKLSVNINKFATLRNSHGGNNPDVVKAAIDLQRFGADRVAVHPEKELQWLLIRFQKNGDILK